jgi:ParB-like chromosome segregation protein Spo0J
MPKVKISDIVLDPAAQARIELSEQVVCEYAEAMKAGDDFPVPHLVFDGFIHYVADGHHRVKAARLAGLTEIDAIVTNGSLRDAVLIAVGANTSHGLRRTLEDRRKAVRILLADEEWGQWSDAEIARACKVSRELVAKMRSQSGGIPEVVQCNRGGKQFSTRPSRRRRELYPAKTSRMPDEVFDPREVEIEELRAAAESVYREKEAVEERLTAALAGGDEAAREEAFQRLTAMREELRLAEIERKAVTSSRDQFQRESAEMLGQLKSQQRFIAHLKKRCTCGAFDG